MKTTKLRLYCDGSCRGNGQENNNGGWAYYLLSQEENEPFTVIYCDSKQVTNTTNNRMELIAAIEGCEKIMDYLELNKGRYITDIQCEVYTDSAYIHNCMSQKWYKNWIRNNWYNSKKQPVKNKDLWEQLIPFFDNPKFCFYKVKGHSNNKNDHSFWNNEADKLARGLNESNCN